MFQYPFPMLAMTSDIAVFKVGHKDSRALHVLMIERGGNPYKGYLALPGGFMNAESETAFECVKRETFEETNLVIPDKDINFVGMWDEPYRDPRGRTVSSCYYVVINDEQAKECKAGDDAASYQWVEVNDILFGYTDIKVAFDHAEMIRVASKLFFSKLNG